MPRKSSKPPKSDAHAALGRYLRTLREYQGLSTREMPFSSSTISGAENGHARVTRDVLREYAQLCYGNAEREKELERLYWAMIQAHMELEDRRKNVERTMERREALVKDFRLVVREIAAEIRGYSQYSWSSFEKFDERIIERLADGNEQLRRRLKEAGMPKDWRDSLRS
ncbi:helix-turn-helix transcriptional regulator [Thermopolyspora sp. NPDC052614]|uniref:helix-turn-helix domain-containing protein n=1 Tax=Thermopolyspora sp. NPDC052614 TaxID=3155682 RepID=UPI0034474049